MKHRFDILHALAIAGILCVIGPIGWMIGVEALRLNVARPALDQLRALGAEISSAPVAFQSKCAYFVFFEPTSSLSDANAEALLALNQLPEGNVVFLYVETPAVTDGSLQVLERLAPVRRLDVRQSSISDAAM